jgi:nanoRNase/pAp phosphatase (c-di-AMP/oligoRNAs hydrolase)
VAETYRLITRNDFDGLVCAALFRSLGLVNEIVFVHPKDMQDGKVPVSDRDITANLPYTPGVHLAFDHHASEVTRLGTKPENLVLDPAQPSAARVVYEHYGGKKAFPKISAELMGSVDQADAAEYTEFDQIFEPTGWNLLNYILDPRTGLSKLPFKKDQDKMVRELADVVGNKSADQILDLPDVKERVERYRDEEMKARDQIKKNSTVHKNLVVVDLRKESTIHAVNRFVVYTMFPKQNISLTALRADDPDTVLLAVGRSILNQTSKTNVGALMLEFGGGGHAGAGTCRASSAEADGVMKQLIERITADG